MGNERPKLVDCEDCGPLWPSITCKNHIDGRYQCLSPVTTRPTSVLIPLGVEVNDDDDDDPPASSFAFVRNTVSLLPLL
jgi:hypothetical protein